jgi:aminoglycoside 3-N-acetyltransferase
LSHGTDYDREDVERALRDLGVREGDVVLSHTSVGMLGRPQGGLARATLAELFLAAFRAVLGPEGTWILPAYTYSYTRGEPFDPAVTPPRNMGILPEEYWRRPDFERSRDPIFSVIATGGRARAMTADFDGDCFGPSSVYARLIEADGSIVNVGIGTHSALLHHVEQQIGVPYRYPKRFSGVTVVEGDRRESEVLFNVRDLSSERTVAYFMRLDADARADGSVRTARVGRGEINLLRARRMAELARAGIARDPEYLTLADRAGAPTG